MKSRVVKGNSRLSLGIDFPWNIQTDVQLTVGLVAVPIVATATGTGLIFLVQAVNRSTGGQNIRIGSQFVSFAPPIQGILLATADAYESMPFKTDFGTGLYAIADGAGALLDVEVWIKLLV